ncbi:ABC transporter permease [Candidatus Bathyarchaeota archaeon]|nr:ABC transporter permease [Candidatus Bathyarchaeota archaeon]
MSLRDRLLQAYAALFYIFLFGPIAIVILFTFNDFPYAVFPLRGFTLKWFETITTGPLSSHIRRTLWTSVKVAAVTGLIVCILGTLASFGLVRYRFRARSIINILVLLPLIVPYILYAVSLLTFYTLFKIHYSMWTIILGHIAVTLPFSILMISATLWGFNRKLEEASSDLGANELQTFRRITFPLIRNGIISGALIGFLLSFNEFIIAEFTSGPGSTTLPVYMWGMWWTCALPELNVISTTIIGIVAILFIVVVVLLPKRMEFRF